MLEGDTIKFHRAVGDFGSTMPWPSAWSLTIREQAHSNFSRSQARREANSSRAASTAPSNAALKDVFADAFKVGVAVNRSITTGQAFRRSADEVANDVAHVKRHFNHVVAENEMKWQLIHPRAGADGYDFAAADALIAFAEANQMEVAGHTLVWHSQTPNWVFEGDHEPSDPAAQSRRLTIRTQRMLH